VAVACVYGLKSERMHALSDECRPWIEETRETNCSIIK
jgi:hypothetical protein